MPLFSVNVRIINEYTLRSDQGEINMVLFDGYVDAPFFKGKILPGACDTQKYLKNEVGMLSARYMLSGKDDEDRDVKIFIENNACLEDGKWRTKPWILTDSERLSYLSRERLYGEIEGTDNGVIIHFYRENEA